MRGVAHVYMHGGDHPGQGPRCRHRPHDALTDPLLGNVLARGLLEEGRSLGLAQQLLGIQQAHHG